MQTEKEKNEILTFANFILYENLAISVSNINSITYDEELQVSTIDFNFPLTIKQNVLHELKINENIIVLLEKIERATQKGNNKTFINEVASSGVMSAGIGLAMLEKRDKPKSTTCGNCRRRKVISTEEE